MAILISQLLSFLITHFRLMDEQTTLTLGHRGNVGTGGILDKSKHWKKCATEFEYLV